MKDDLLMKPTNGCPANLIMDCSILVEVRSSYITLTVHAFGHMS